MTVFKLLRGVFFI